MKICEKLHSYGSKQLFARQICVQSISEKKLSYQICVLCFKCINKTAPSYLSDLLEQYVPSRLLRSGSQNLLKIPPRANKKCTEKAFKHCAPYIWNSLPSDIREAKSESQFKNYLKTHLFKSHLCI